MIDIVEARLMMESVLGRAMTGEELRDLVAYVRRANGNE